MSELDSPMQELQGADDSEKRGGKGHLIGIALGAIGIALGLTAIFMARATARELEATAALGPQLAELTEKVSGIDGRLNTAGSQLSQLATANRQMQDALRRDIQGQVQAVVEATIAKDVRDNRARINEITTRIGEMTTAISSRPAPAAAPERGADAPDAPAGGTPAPGGGQNHTIRSGDTFAKLAKQHGLPLQALLDANPGIDARNLRIGQVIVIPAAQ